MRSRALRTVSKSDWCLGDGIGARQSRLLDVPTPDELLAEVIREALDALQAGSACFRWQPACEATGFFRIEAQFPLSEKTFDQFFNGRSGYRAQYYLSPEEGVLYNRDVTQALIPVLADARARQWLPDDLELVIASVNAPHAKVWVHGDRVFELAQADSLNPPRWVQNNARLGRRAPLPSELRLELKGAFIHPASKELFVDALKADRACVLFRTGYA